MSAEAEALPGPLRSVSSSPFVGRATELAELVALLPRAAGEGRRVALLAGEPGAGKSRLVREFAGHAAADGALVLSGACDAVVRTPYGAFIEVLERLISMTGVGPLRAALGPGGGELQRLLPDLPGMLGSLPEPVAADPDTERHRLHTAVAELLGNVSLERPILLVVEDCHWADAPTLQLIRHLSRSAASARMLLLATFRDGEAEVPRELAETLADLRRSEDVVRMRLAGLSEAEISELISRSAGVESEPEPGLSELAATIHGLTGGNAFLVCELWRALLETGIVEVGAGGPRVTRPLSELGTPESVGEVVSQRLARLDARTTDLLELAAVAGPEFELEPIRQAAGLAEPAFLLALEEAVASGMIEELPSQRLACRFTHEIVRRALYDQLSRLRRAELHLRVGEALEAGAGAGDRGLPDLAHHFAAAAQLGGADRAIEYNLRAARVASAALAYDDAAVRLQAAVEIGIADPAQRADVLLDLGSASHRAGNATEALTAFESAAEIARDLGAERLARAAVGYEEACWRPGLTNAAAVELLEEALEAVEDDGEELRIDLLAGLARALSSMGDPRRGAVVRENAIELARRREDRAALAKVLVRSYWAQGVTPREEILAMLTEAKDLASLMGSAETQTEAMAWRVPTLVSLCDLGAARAEIAALREMAERTGQPFMNHVAEHYGSAIALCEGDLTAAEVMAERSRDWGLLLSGRDASGSYGIQMFGIRREQGRLAELAPAVRVLAAGERVGPWQPGLVAVLAELGMEEEARLELARIRAGGLDEFRSSLWLAALTYLTDACAALGDEEMAAVLYPELEPFVGANVMIGHLVACYGAADRYLGMLAATLGEPALAERHFERAMEINREMGASAWLAHSAYEYGRFLGGRGRGERERSEALLGEATSLAERLGMRGLLDKAGSPPSRQAAPEIPAGLSPREAQILGLVAAGLSNREIGAELSISEHTAANHIRAILRKTGCANRTEAASFAHRHGLAPS